LTSRRSRSHSESEGKAAIEVSKKSENNLFLCLTFPNTISIIARMKGKKKKMGRPTLRPKNRRTALITLRLTSTDRALLLKEAKAKGLSISNYLFYCWKKGR
jgi:hypothetical protein